MTARDDEELAVLLSDLETTLRDLREELDDEPRRGRKRDDTADTRRRSSDGEPPFDPPSVADVLRFTEEYTLPTLIATLEATIEALELFRRILGLATPGDTDRRVSRSRSDRRDRGVLDTALSEAGTQASDQLADRLADLRTALSETDLPADEDARSIVADARELTEEIEARVRDADAARSADRRRGTRSADGERARRDDSTTDADDAPSGGSGDGPVTIEVGSPDDGDEAGDGGGSIEAVDDDADAAPDTAGESDDGDDHPEVDVDAELESIKREMRDDEATADGDSEDDPTADSAEDTASESDDDQQID